MCTSTSTQSDVCQLLVVLNNECNVYGIMIVNRTLLDFIRVQKISSATNNEEMHNSHTEKVENCLTEISHKLLCDIHMTVLTT